MGGEPFKKTNLVMVSKVSVNLESEDYIFSNAIKGEGNGEVLCAMQMASS